MSKYNIGKTTNLRVWKNSDYISANYTFLNKHKHKHKGWYKVCENDEFRTNKIHEKFGWNIDKKYKKTWQNCKRNII